MKRLLTGVLAALFGVVGIFFFPPVLFLVLVLAIIVLAALEYGRLGAVGLPAAPWWMVPIAAPASLLLLALVGPWEVTPLPSLVASDGAAMAALLLLPFLLGLGVLLARTPIEQAPAAIGLIHFGALYLAVPGLAAVWLRQADPWWLFLLVVVIWLGDTAAYYGGTRFGRHRLAPVVSPKKSWEGAAFGLAGSVIGAAIWSAGRLGEVDLRVLLAGLVAALAGQLGDLVESLFKRAVGVKDSGTLLPGHGGVLDRMDAFFFAALPFFLVLRWSGLIV